MDELEKEPGIYREKTQKKSFASAVFIYTVMTNIALVLLMT